MKILIPLAVTGGAFYLFFMKSDEDYLRKTTVKMIDLLVSPLDSSNMSALIGRVRQVSEPMHFSVKFEVFQNDKTVFKRESASEIRSLVGMYFKAKERITLQNIKEENLTVQISKENNKNKTAEVLFLITGQSQGEKLSCQVRMDWKHEKKNWRIYLIQVFNCQGLTIDTPY